MKQNSQSSKIKKQETKQISNQNNNDQIWYKN